MRKYLLRIAVMLCFSFPLLFGTKAVVKASVPEFELEQDISEETNQVVTVEVYADYSEVVEAKWCKGKESINYFRNNGEDVLYAGEAGYFEVTSNAVYTVYLKDKLGREAVQTITIDNIDKKKPSIDYNLDATDRGVGVITLQVEDNVAVDKVVYYYGKLKDPEDDRWANGNEVKGNTFNIYRNGTVSVKATDTAGNAKIKYISIKYINKTNKNLNYGMKEKVQVASYYGILTLNIQSIESITLTDDRPAYLVNYYLDNISYGGKKTCYSTNLNFKVYDSKGRELETACYDYSEEHKTASILPKYISSNTGANCSFLVYGTEEPSYLEYYYWDDNLDRSFVKILCETDYKQNNEDPTPTANSSEIVTVTDSTQSNGTYSGTIVDGVLQGVGVYTYLNGDVYTGEFYKGKAEGYGEIVFKYDGSVYRGGFINNARNGYGVYYDSNGVTYTGLWEDNLFVEGKIISNRGTVLWYDRNQK